MWVYKRVQHSARPSDVGVFEEDSLDTGWLGTLETSLSLSLDFYLALDFFPLKLFLCLVGFDLFLKHNAPT